ncbi:MAG: hypothetical protein AYP45_11880 [Candidatus Brocadia carolinensis]|uniref:Uncharacterized protein n=1 Tax=Candidatus Brocadia carolinensis TaxID=1004156 RepID=A0A1V4AS75_9BACT|nr:MAG: hypothetical protein AYP45_11880 [Candidatus Brocadia caroliniensis]
MVVCLLEGDAAVPSFCVVSAIPDELNSLVRESDQKVLCIIILSTGVRCREELPGVDSRICPFCGKKRTASSETLFPITNSPPGEVQFLTCFI